MKMEHVVALRLLASLGHEIVALRWSVNTDDAGQMHRVDRLIGRPRYLALTLAAGPK